MVEKPLEESPTFEPVVVPDGIYKAKVKEYRVNVHPQYGESLIIDFEITEGPQAGKVISGFASWKKVTKKTKIYKWALAMGAKVPTQIGETFNPDNMIGKECRILTTQVQRVDRMGKPFWQSIVKDVLSLTQTAVTGGAPAPSPQQPQESGQTAEEKLNNIKPNRIHANPKIPLLNQLRGKDFTEEDLLNLGFTEKEIDSLRTMGYIFEPKPGILRLTL